MTQLRLSWVLGSFATRKMDSYTASSCASPFTRAVVNSMRKLYPESLADRSFDNTGRKQVPM